MAKHKLLALTQEGKTSPNIFPQYWLIITFSRHLKLCSLGPAAKICRQQSTPGFYPKTQTTHKGKQPHFKGTERFSGWLPEVGAGTRRIPVRAHLGRRQCGYLGWSRGGRAGAGQDTSHRGGPRLAPRWHSTGTWCTQCPSAGPGTSACSPGWNTGLSCNLGRKKKRKTHCIIQGTVLAAVERIVL